MGLRSRTFVVIFFGRKSRTFEDISELSKCPCADILRFFPALPATNGYISSVKPLIEEIKTL